jgi:hypothetical protein
MAGEPTERSDAGALRYGLTESGQMIIQLGGGQAAALADACQPWSSGRSDQVDRAVGLWRGCGLV